MTLYERKGKSISESDISLAEAEYDNYNGGLDGLDLPTTNNYFCLDPLPATTNTHDNYYIMYDDNNDTHSYNNIIMDNEYDPEN